MPGTTSEKVTLWDGYPGADGGVIVPSATGKGSYTARFDGVKGFCQCRHAKKYGGIMDGRDRWCRHVLSVNAGALSSEVELLKSRLMDDTVGEGLWGSFEEVVRGVLEFRKRDANLVATAFLLTAYSQGEACADDVHPLVGDKIEGDPRIIGVVLGSLLRKGIVKKMGSKPSTRRATNHGREIKAYSLTGSGRELLVAMVVEKNQRLAGHGE